MSYTFKVCDKLCRSIHDRLVLMLLFCLCTNDSLLCGSVFEDVSRSISHILQQQANSSMMEHKSKFLFVNSFPLLFPTIFCICFHSQLLASVGINKMTRSL